MKEELDQLKTRALEKIKCSDSLDTLNDIRVAFLGKKGELTNILKSMKDVAADERPKVGAMVNDVRTAIEEQLLIKREAFEEKLLEAKMGAESIDVTLPAARKKIGHSHPNTVALDEVKRIFVGMGYEVVEGPEIE